MNPQGSGPVNSDFFTNLTAQINGLQGPSACTELQTLANAAMADIDAQLAAIKAQIAALVPVITIPGASPGAIVGWITSFVAPYVKATQTLEAQAAQITSEVAALEQAITAAAGRMLSCQVTIPTVTQSTNSGTS